MEYASRFSKIFQTIIIQTQTSKLQIALDVFDEKKLGVTSDILLYIQYFVRIEKTEVQVYAISGHHSINIVCKMCS